MDVSEVPVKRLFLLPVVCICAVGISSAADPQLVGLMMPDAKTLAGANVTQVLSSPLGQFLLGKTPVADPNYQQFLQASGFDPTRDISQIVAASSGTPQQQTGLVAIRGNFDLTKILAFLKLSGAKVDQSQGVAVIASPDGKGSVAILDNTTAIAGDPASVTAAIARRSSPSMLDPVLVAKANSLSASQDAWVVSTMTMPATPPQAGGIDLSALASIQQSSAGIKLGTSIVFSAEAVEDTPQHASSLADLLRMGVAFASMNQNDPKAAQLASVLKSLAIATQGNALQITLSIPEGLVEQLAPAEHKPADRAALEPK